MKAKLVKHESGYLLYDKDNNIVNSNSISSTITQSSTSSLSMEEITSSIMSTIIPICSSFIPLVVIAGVPTLSPDVRKGDRLSKGTMFLLTVIWDRTSVFSTFFPEISGNFVLRSISKR